MNTKRQILLCFLLSLLGFYSLPAQQVEHLFVVTTDGLRWQELFMGADTSLIQKNIQDSESYFKKYCRKDAEENRRLLMPFLWNVLAKNAQVYGNRNNKNFVNTSNSSCISYPGYSEMMSGHCDNKRIHSNSKKRNPNSHVLEHLSKSRKTAAFCSWDVFPYILNEERAGFPVNAGFETLDGWGTQATMDRLNTLQKQSRKPWKKSVRPDSLTWEIARNYLQETTPEVLFLAFGETDEYAHEGNYGAYLDAAHQFDEILSELWKIIQNDARYAGKSALIITTDHGRGENIWRHHHDLIKGSSEIWLIASGAGIAPTGEQQDSMQLYQNQIAQTLAHLMQDNFECEHAVAPPISQIFEASPILMAGPHQPSPLLNASSETGLPRK